MKKSRGVTVSRTSIRQAFENAVQALLKAGFGSTSPEQDQRLLEPIERLREQITALSGFTMTTDGIPLALGIPHHLWPLRQQMQTVVRSDRQGKTCFDDSPHTLSVINGLDTISVFFGVSPGGDQGLKPLPLEPAISLLRDHGRAIAHVRLRFPTLITWRSHVCSAIIAEEQSGLTLELVRADTRVPHAWNAGYSFCLQS